MIAPPYRLRSLFAKGLAVLVTVCLSAVAALAREAVLLNVSYDPTREFYEDINRAFAADWLVKTGGKIQIRQSHGGSGKQARSVIEGLRADVVTLALAYDIDAIAERGKALDPAWQKRLPHNSCPSTSTIVLVVRKGNPKKVRDWRDLGQPGIDVVTPNPKTSGGARWNFLAAYGAELRRSNGDHEAAKNLLQRIFANVRVLDAGARGATMTFLQRGTGDVLIAWESEALLVAGASGAGQVEIVYPAVSVLAEPPVAVADRYAKRNGNEKAAAAYLDFLFTPAGQEIAAKHHFRPSDPAVASRHSQKFPKIELFTVDEMFGGWKMAHEAHFSEGGTVDQIQRRK